MTRQRRSSFHYSKAYFHSFFKRLNEQWPSHWSFIFVRTHKRESRLLFVDEIGLEESLKLLGELIPRHFKTSEHIGLYLRSWRKAHQLRLQDVSERTGITIANLSLIENGRKGIGKKTMARLNILWGAQRDAKTYQRKINAHTQQSVVGNPMMSGPRLSKGSFPGPTFAQASSSKAARAAEGVWNMSVNRFFLVGHLGQDPELKTTKNGRPFCRLNVATNERGSNVDGEDFDRTTWHSVHVFGKQAEWSCSRLHKGACVFIEARVDKSTDDLGNGEKKTQIFFTARQVTSFSPMPQTSREDTLPTTQDMDTFVVPNA